jgi:hypothetical protein
MILKRGNGESRGIIGFDLPAGGMDEDDVAYLRLFVDPIRDNRGQGGTWVVLNLVSECDGAPEWIEGSHRVDRFYCVNKCARVDDDATCPTDVAPGVTWKCPIDADISDGQPDCPQQWNGAQAFVRRSPSFAKDFFDGAPLDPDAPAVLVTDDARAVMFDVTEHVRRAYACGDLTPSWIVRRASHSGGKIWFFSREAREGLCACGRLDLCADDEVDPALYIGPEEGLE